MTPEGGEQALPGRLDRALDPPPDLTVGLRTPPQGSEGVAESAVTYSIEGYSLNMPIELHTFAPYWGGFADPASALRMARGLDNHVLRLVKVTREVIGEPILPSVRSES